MGITFTHPYYLFLIVLLPVLVFLHFFLLKIRRDVAVRFANFDALARIRGIDMYSKNLVVVLITMVAVFCGILALSGLTIQHQVSSSAFSYAIAIDVSQSMEANDLLPSRMAVAKQAASDFVDQTPEGTRIAIITFSGSAFLDQAITDDKTALKGTISNIQVSTIGGTDIREAMISATNELAQENSKALILMSDGRLNVGDLQEGIDYATKNNVVIHTIGLGTAAGGNYSLGLSRLEEDSLKSVAFATGGQYFHVVTAQQFSDAMKSIMKYQLKNVSTDMTPYMMMAIIALIIIQYILVNTRFKSFP